MYKFLLLVFGWFLFGASLAVKRAPPSVLPYASIHILSLFSLMSCVCFFSLASRSSSSSSTTTTTISLFCFLFTTVFLFDFVICVVFFSEC